MDLAAAGALQMKSMSSLLLFLLLLLLCFPAATALEVSVLGSYHAIRDSGFEGLYRCLG